jgi:8-oxo-dGTP pyrophosphatase MutT (NUDIX family)
MSSDFNGSKIISDERVSFAGNAAGKEPFFKLRHMVVEENGEQSDRIFWERGSFVVIVAIDERGRLILIREFKHAARKLILGLPAGGIFTKKDETPVEAALRELAEETGYSGAPENCTVMGPFEDSPDKTTAIQYLVLVENAKREGAPAPETTELIVGVQRATFQYAKKHMSVALHLMAVHMAEDYLETRSNAVVANLCKQHAA